MSLSYNINIDQGADFQLVFEIVNEDGEPFNLTGYNVISQMRRGFYSEYAEDDFTEITCDITDATNGQITMFLPHSDTLSMKTGRYVYDLDIISDSNFVTRVLEGTASVNPGVTVVE